MSGVAPQRYDAPADGGWALDPEVLFDELIQSGEDWATKDAAAELLTETRKPLLHKLGTESPERSESGKERAAYSHDSYREHVEKMVAARLTANLAKVRYSAIQVKIELLRTRETSRRAELNLR